MASLPALGTLAMAYSSTGSYNFLIDEVNQQGWNASYSPSHLGHPRP